MGNAVPRRSTALFSDDKNTTPRIKEYIEYLTIDFDWLEHVDSSALILKIILNSVDFYLCTWNFGVANDNLMSLENEGKLEFLEMNPFCVAFEAFG